MGHGRSCHDRRVSTFLGQQVGDRQINALVIGATDVSTQALFLSTAMYFQFLSSGGGDTTCVLEVHDGATIVTSVADANFDINGNAVTVSFVRNADGSGSATFSQAGGGTNTLTWGARTWTNGLGNNHGFNLDWSGIDGAAQLTRSQVDDFLLDTPAGAAVSKLTLMGVT